ncbi:GntR family transcriptional regulator [Rhodothermus profundi]|uniref:Transcriptional regulator, GntR family n=1 Tax=Rhodothermus profundi TaxID=633813 RepID=A0A1M6UKT3_9BACT|nr:GntR family transcriptional regulator [Rhodothermus profundi]SHK69822.1 transcriptional regulator, GntR family [Rhodothermus profundi]
MRVRRISLADQAYEALEHRIVTLRLVPGTVVTEQELVEDIGIGRTPLREAVLRLAQEHLVTVLPRKGIYISEINLTEQLAVLEVRRELDRLMVRRAARLARPQERAQFARLAQAMRQLQEPDLDAFMQLDRRFDHLVEAACHNRFAVRAVAPLHTLSRRFWYAYHHEGDLEEAIQLHTQLMECIAEEAVEAAEAASEELIRAMERFTHRVIQRTVAP